jgi:hypothetical protein
MFFYSITIATTPYRQPTATGTPGTPIGSVRFFGTAVAGIDNIAPYQSTPLRTPGTYSITAIPYNQPGALGTPGSGFSSNLVLVNQTPTPTFIPSLTPSPTPTATPSCTPPNCAIDGSDDIPDPETWSSEDGVYVEALGTTVYGNGTCNGLGTNEDRLDCADDVYDAYYDGFGSTPTLEDILAAIFDEELGTAVTADEDAVEPTVEAFANNYLAVCGEGCTKAELVWWLASKQGWYSFAGHSLTNLINATSRSSYSPTAAGRVFSETWTGGYGDGNVPYDWGNWAYGTSGYTSIRNTTQTVEYYQIWQAWFDLHSYLSSSPRTNWLPASEADPVSASYTSGTYNHPVWP